MGKPKKNMEYVKILVKKHDSKGECLSTEYINAKTYLEFKCSLRYN